AIARERWRASNANSGRDGVRGCQFEGWTPIEEMTAKIGTHTKGVISRRRRTKDEGGLGGVIGAGRDKFFGADDGNVVDVESHSGSSLVKITASSVGIDETNQ